MSTSTYHIIVESNNIEVRRIPYASKEQASAFLDLLTAKFWEYASMTMRDSDNRQLSKQVKIDLHGSITTYAVREL